MKRNTVDLTRVFDAPRGRVFECWTRAEHLEHWFGPHGFTIHSAETDPRPGGIFKLCMRAPGGSEHWVRGAYREVTAPEHLVIECTADERLHEIIQVDFTESGGKTIVTIHAVASGAGDEAEEMLKGMDKGWAQTVDRLGTHLKGR